MTCLIGMIQNGKTYIGADGYATTDDCERKPIVCRKIFKSGRYVIAFAGHIRTGQLLYPESGFEFPDDIYQIPNAMFLWLQNFDVLGKDENQMGMMASNFLIATKNNLYEILMDMQISEIDPNEGYTALGSGTPYAMGSLYSTSFTRMPPKKRIGMALDAANRFVKNCGPPYQIYTFPEAQRTLKCTYYKPAPAEENEE